MSIERIRTLPIFDGLTPAEFDDIAKVLESTSYTAGQIIAREDEDLGEPMILAWSGTIQVLKNAGQPSEKVLTTLAAPTIVGELELITDIPYSAALKAEQDIQAFKFGRSKFHEMREASHVGVMKMVYNMAKILAMRLYHTNKALTAATTADDDKLDDVRRTTLTWTL